jgi:hypothetical protein
MLSKPPGGEEAEGLGGTAYIAVVHAESPFAGASSCTTLKWVGSASRDPGGPRIGGGGAYHEVVFGFAGDWLDATSAGRQLPTTESRDECVLT